MGGADELGDVQHYLREYALINGTSMRFGSQLEVSLKMIFGYRAIAHFAHNKNGSCFQKWPPTIFFLLTSQV